MIIELVEFIKFYGRVRNKRFLEINSYSGSFDRLEPRLVQWKCLLIFYKNWFFEILQYWILRMHHSTYRGIHYQASTVLLSYLLTKLYSFGWASDRLCASPFTFRFHTPVAHKSFGSTSSSIVAFSLLRTCFHARVFLACNIIDR